MVSRCLRNCFLIVLNSLIRVTCCSLVTCLIRSIMLNVLLVSVVAVCGLNLVSKFNEINCVGIVLIRPVRNAATLF